MRHIVGAMLLAVAGGAIVAHAQQQPERQFTLTITESEARLVDAGLGELPTKATFALVNKLHQQLTEQLKAYDAASGAAAEKAIRDKITAEQKAKDGAVDNPK
jgi:hypothetical protein